MIRLEPQHIKPKAYTMVEGHVEIDGSWAPPYFKANNPNANYIHMVRAVTTYVRHGVTSHAAIGYLCGNTGFLEPGNKRRRGRFLDTIPEGGEICLACLQKHQRNQRHGSKRRLAETLQRGCLQDEHGPDLRHAGNPQPAGTDHSSIPTTRPD